MVICHCMAVSDRSIRDAARAGAADVDDVAMRCGAGSMCGGCRPAVADVLADCHTSAVRVGIRSVVRGFDPVVAPAL